MIDDSDPTTWREGEEVEAVLVTRRGLGNLIEVPGGGLLRAHVFSEVRPVGGGVDPEHIRTVKRLRQEVVEERLAAASARSETAVARQDAERVRRDMGSELARMRHDADLVARSRRLAVAALKRIRQLDATGPIPPLPFLDVLLPTDDRQGSLAMPCDAALDVVGVAEGCSCETPCMETLEVQPCILPLGHEHVSDAKAHVTLTGREFERGESAGEDED